MILKKNSKLKSYYSLKDNIYIADKREKEPV